MKPELKAIFGGIYGRTLYFNERGNQMKKGDKVNVKDGSYGFGIQNGQYCTWLNNQDNSRKNLTVVETGLSVMKQAGKISYGEFRQQNDLLVTDEQGNFWFAQSRFCELVNKEIEVRYFCDGADITDSVSDETKRNLKAI